MYLVSTSYTFPAHPSYMETHAVRVVGEAASDMCAACCMLRAACCMRAYVPACLRTCVPACLSACLPTCLPACMPVCLPVSLPACLSVSLPACLPACMPAYLSTCQPAYPSANCHVRTKHTVKRDVTEGRRHSNRNYASEHCGQRVSFPSR